MQAACLHNSTFCYIKLFSASGEAILGTQRYFCIAKEPHTAKLQWNRFLTKKSFKNEGLAVFCPKNILFLKAIFKNNTFLNVFLISLNSTLSKHFTQALYQSTLSRYYNRVYQGITIACIKVFLTHFRSTYQTSLHKLICRGEVLRSITCVFLDSAPSTSTRCHEKGIHFISTYQTSLY